MQDRNWIPVFKTGAHTDTGGNTRTWTERDLDHIVNSYNPRYHEAPVVIGHPKDNAPAWGWVESLKREGNTLYSKLRDIVPEFVDMVKNGLFKKRSISLYPDGSLRHIGFLGAAPPAVKGLPDFAFSCCSGAFFEFADSALSDIKGEIDRLNTEDQFIKDISDLIIQEMKKDKALSYDEAFKVTVNKNPDIRKRFEDIEAEIMRKKIMDGGVEGLLDILTSNKVKNENMSFSRAFTEVQIEYPELAVEYAEKIRP